MTSTDLYDTQLDALALPTALEHDTDAALVMLTQLSEHELRMSIVTLCKLIALAEEGMSIDQARAGLEAVAHLNRAELHDEGRA